MSRSKVRVEIEPMPLAVSISSLVNLMQFVVIAFLLVCVAMMVTLQLAKARTHRREPQAKRSGEGQAPIFLSREEWTTPSLWWDRGKRSATTFVDGTTAATSMSCNSDKRRVAVAANETGGTADGDARGTSDVFAIVLTLRLSAAQSRQITIRCQQRAFSQILWRGRIACVSIRRCRAPGTIAG